LGLGRQIAIDFRDRNYLLQPPKKTAKPTRRQRHWITNKALDQGDTSACVGYAGAQFLLSAPVKNKLAQNPFELYRQCQRHDEWDGEEPTYYGTSVRALMKVLKAQGYISEYRWAFDAETVVNHVLNHSPVIVGTNWYNKMFYPDYTGFIQIGGRIAGGHAYMISGVNLDKLCPDYSRGAFRIINSWGREWGDKGRAWISIRDMSRLISEWGEACAASEIRFKPETKDV
jgi:hypothetical protein